MVGWPSKGTLSLNTAGHQQFINPSQAGVMLSRWYLRVAFTAIVAHVHFAFRAPQNQADAGSSP